MKILFVNAINYLSQNEENLNIAFSHIERRVGSVLIKWIFNYKSTNILKVLLNIIKLYYKTNNYKWYPGMSHKKRKDYFTAKQNKKALEVLYEVQL